MRWASSRLLRASRGNSHPVPGFVGGWPPPGDGFTQTPIKHVIVIIGENRSFDHVFATYVPKNGQTVHNLLSEGIITLDANKNAIPGPNFQKAQQLAATDQGSTDPFLLSPPKQSFPNNQLPAPLVGGPKVNYIYSGWGYFLHLPHASVRDGGGADRIRIAGELLS